MQCLYEEGFIFKFLKMKKQKKKKLEHFNNAKLTFSKKKKTIGGKSNIRIDIYLSAVEGDDEDISIYIHEQY